MATEAPTPQPPGAIFLPALLTSLLLYCAHFPLGIGWLGWVALVPLLTLTRHPGPRWRIYLAAYLSGVAFYLPVLRWLPTSDSRMNYAWGFLVVYGSLYPLVGLWLIRWLDRRARWPLVLSAPCVWVGLEYVKGTVMTGFAWYLMAHTQHDLTLLIQIADLGGAWFVSLVVVAVNALVTELWLARAPDPRWSRRGLLLQGAAVFGVLLLALGYGAYRLSEEALRPGPVVALVQGDVEQGYRNEGFNQAGKIRRYVEEHYYTLTYRAATYHPELIAWPETAIGGDFYVNTNAIPLEQIPLEGRICLQSSRDYFQSAATILKSSLLLGLNTWVPQEDGKLKRHNSGVFVPADGQPVDAFHKIHCVPFGEYVPMRWMESMMPFDYAYMIHPGSALPRFRLPGEQATTFGVLICYEDTDPRVSRPYGGSDGKEPVDFLLNISNDGWFFATAEHAEHLAICRFRAVENRRSVARAVNRGISAVVDSNGRVLKPTVRPTPTQLGLIPWTGTGLSGLGGIALPALAVEGNNPATLWEIPPDKKSWQALPVGEWKQFEVTPGLLIASVPLDNRTSFYVQWGDWLPWTCWAIVALGILTPWRWFATAQK